MKFYKVILTIVMVMFLVNTQANTQDNKMAQLQEVINESKLLPTPIGVGGDGASFGESVAIDGNRALIGSPRALEHGVAYIFDYDGTTWNETQMIFPDDLEINHRFGHSVSLQGDRAFISDNVNRTNDLHQAGAVYIYELTDGVWQQKQKLIASDAGGTDEFGTSVSLSGDRVLIGAMNYDDANNGFNSGAVYVFDYDGNNWQESAILTTTNGSSNDNLGNSVSLDGDKALVGARNFDDNSNGINTGSAYLFELNTGTGAWSQSHQFLASDGITGDRFGIDVSVSANRVFIGASQTDENFGASGSVYIYEFDGTIWEETKLLAPDAAAGDLFGTTVSIENNRLLVGAINGEELGSNTGSAYIFDFDTGINLWVLTEEISADDFTNSGFFASSLGLSGDKIIVGNFNDRRDGNNTGAAYVFDLDGSWQQSQKIIAQGATGDNFGTAVSIDGNRALIGAPLDKDNGPSAGAVYIFDYINGQWSTPFKLLASDVSNGFGSAVDLDNNNAIIAANRIDVAGSGTVYIYNFNGSAWVETALLKSSPGQSDGFGSSVSLSGDKAVVGSAFRNGSSNRSGVTYVYELNHVIGDWEETHQLIITDGETGDLFGSSVSILEDRILVGASSKDGDINGLSRSGAAYIFDYDVNTDSWLETKLLVDDPRSNDFFGSSVDLGNNRAIIGARNGFGVTGQTGSAYIFDYDTLTNTWSSIKILASDASGLDQFGGSVSLDGNRVLVGAYNDLDNGIRAGSVYQYEFDNTNWIEVKKYIASDAATRDNYGWSVSLSGTKALFGAPQDNNRGTDSGSVYTINDIDLLFADGFEQ